MVSETQNINLHLVLIVCSASVYECALICKKKDADDETIRRLIGNETRRNSQPTNLYERTQTIRQQSNLFSFSSISFRVCHLFIIIKNFPISLSASLKQRKR